MLTILSPKQQVKQLQLTLLPQPTLAPEFQLYFEEKPLATPRPDLINETVSYYQTASDFLKKKKYQK